MSNLELLMVAAGVGWPVFWTVVFWLTIRRARHLMLIVPVAGLGCAAGCGLSFGLTLWLAGV